MTEPTSHCPDCGTALPADSPQALCPACLMRQALASRTIVDGGKNVPVSPPLSPEEIADRFPGFEILECLGRGGMGVVYKARQKSLGRMVAIKILPPERVGEARFAERFAVEAETLAKLSHPNIVTVHDFGEIRGLFYIVMEYVDGVNLRDLLREGKLEPQQALAIVPPICDALQYAHDKGVVHRDIKPENLLLDKDGRVKIADFGIAKLMGAAGEIAGTPPYMAPEQSGVNIDHRADIYALGVVLYEMLTGERPDKEIIAPSRKVQIDVRLDEMVLRALEKEPERRYQTASEFRTMVETMGTAPVTDGFPAQLLKSGESLYATPEFLSTVWGAMKLQQGLGVLLLYSDRLEFQEEMNRTIIPLRSILRLGLVSYPFFQSPAGLRSIEVQFMEAGTKRRLLLTPSRGMFSFVGTTNRCVLEWFGAIREAVQAMTGNMPDGSAAPIIYQGFSGDGRMVTALTMLGVFAGVFGMLAAKSLTGARWNQLLPLAIPLLFLAGFLLALAWSRRRQWQSGHPVPVASASTASPLPGTAGFTAIAVTLLLLLTATNNAKVMMIGAAVALVIGLIWFARGNARVALLVTMASLGVGGSAVLLMHRKQAAAPTQAMSALFRPVEEIILPDPAAGIRCVLDFESGNLLEPPAELVPLLHNDVSQLPPVALRWLRDSGTDAVLAPDGSVRLIEGVVFSPTRQGKALAWGDFTPDQVLGTVAAMSDEQRRVSVNQAAFHIVTLRQPAAVAFSTRERSCGVLQILGASDDPRGLKLRYKLVQNAAPLPPLPPGYQRGQEPPLPPAYEQTHESEAPETTKPAITQTIETINAINDTNRFLDLELAVIDAKASGLGDKHPSVNMAAEVLARFKETHPNIPDAVWRQLVAQRLDKAKEDLFTLTKNGLGHAHPTVVAQQARVRALEDLIGTLETPEAPLVETHKPVPAPADGSNVITLSANGEVSIAGKPCPPDQLDARLKELAGKHFETVVIRPEAGVSLKRVIELTEACKAAGIDAGLVNSPGLAHGDADLNNLTVPGAPLNHRDRIILEDLALQMIVAIREKDDAKLKSMAADRIKGWPESLPAFAVELREHYRQSTGNEAFDLRAGESRVDGDLGAVRCTGPAALGGKCLVLFFIQTPDGWKNHSLRASMENVELTGLLAELRKQIGKSTPAENAPGK